MFSHSFSTHARAQTPLHKETITHKSDYKERTYTKRLSQAGVEADADGVLDVKDVGDADGPWHVDEVKSRIWQQFCGGGPLRELLGTRREAIRRSIRRAKKGDRKEANEDKKGDKT